MNPKRLSYTMPVFAGIVVLLQSCFTGIESTPKITDNDVRRLQTETSAEDHYFDDLKLNYTTADYYIGKKWVVSDPKIKLLLGNNARDAQLNIGDTLSFCEFKKATTFDGRDNTDIVFGDSKGNSFSYRIAQDYAGTVKGKNIDLPFLTDIDVIETISKKLTHQSYYLITRNRYDMRDNLYSGQTYIKVSIDTVAPGNSIYPVRLSVTDPDGNKFRLYISIPGNEKMPRKFSSIFSLSDPKLKYPTITDAVWQQIKNGKVCQGMNRLECRLALGQPDDVNRQVGYSVLREIWSYKNGKYLIFEDGILDSFRQ